MTIKIGDWQGDSFGLKTSSYEAFVASQQHVQFAGLYLPGGPIVETTHDPISQIGGTCYAYALVNWLRYMTNGMLFSGMNLACMTQKMMGVKEGFDLSDIAKGGGNVRSGMAAAIHYGFVQEGGQVDEPSIIDLVDMSETKLASLIDDHAIINIKTALNLAKHGHPCIVCTPVYDEIYTCDDREYELLMDGTYIGSHAWTILAANDETAMLQTTWGKCGIDGTGIYLISVKKLLSVGFDCATGSRKNV